MNEKERIDKWAKRVGHAETRSKVPRHLRIRSNFSNSKLVNPQKKGSVYATIYAMDYEGQLHSVGYGRVVKKGWGHPYWEAKGTKGIPVCIRANRWVLANLRDGEDTSKTPANNSSVAKLVRKYQH